MTQTPQANHLKRKRTPAYQTKQKCWKKKRRKLLKTSKPLLQAGYPKVALQCLKPSLKRARMTVCLWSLLIRPHKLSSRSRGKRIRTNLPFARAPLFMQVLPIQQTKQREHPQKVVPFLNRQRRRLRKSSFQDLLKEIVNLQRQRAKMKQLRTQKLQHCDLVKNCQIQV